MQVMFNCRLMKYVTTLSLGSNIIHCVLSAEVLSGRGAVQSGECPEETGRHQ